MRKTAILPAWARILRGYKPLLSIEITKECPLSCPGCYAYEDEHLGNGTTLRQLSDYKGDSLVEGILRAGAAVSAAACVDRGRRATHSLSRTRGPATTAGPDEHRGSAGHERGAAHPGALGGARVPAPSRVCGRPARAPRYTAQARATYDRILRNITGYRVIVHCTVTAQLLERATYLDDFAAFWSEEWLGLRVS